MKIIKTISGVILFISVLAAPLCAQALETGTVSAQPVQEPVTIAIEINLISGTSMSFYSGNEKHLGLNDLYEVLSDGVKIGEIRITEVGDYYSKADIMKGNFTGYQNKIVILNKLPVSSNVNRYGIDYHESLSRRGPAEIMEEAQAAEELYQETPRKVRKTPLPEKKKAEPPKPKVETIKVPIKPTEPDIETPAPSRSTVVYNGLLRLETHSDKNNPDDYFYIMFSASKPYVRDWIGTYYYMRRENLDHHENHSDTFGVTFTRVIDPRTTGSLGISYTNEDYTYYDFSTRLYLASISRILSKTDLTTHRASLTYTSRTEDMNEDATYFKYQTDHKMDPRYNGRLYYMYTYSNTLNIHTTNQYSAAVLWNDPKLTFEYLFVDKTYAVPSSFFDVDNDEVYRLSYLHTF